MITWSRKHPVTTPPTNGYAMIEDFCDVFDKGMHELYQLSFLLTGDHRKAEECFVAGLEESVTANHVFKEWARSWAKRAIVQNAIRELKPRPPVASLSSSIALHSNRELPNQDQHFKLDWVLSLADFDRFVFVISVLEHYSDQDCAVLLGCSPRQVGEARVRGFQQLTEPLLMVAKGSYQ
jgi:DNA-directed RNA polymerase specialized sigma24 family protein